MFDANQFPKVIDGINWGTRTFNNRDGFTEHTVTAQEKEPEVPKPLKPKKEKPVIIEAMPGEPLPGKCPDYRPCLQRDGLILFSWEVTGDCIRVVWLRSNGPLYKYQAIADDEGEIKTACPDAKYDRDRFGHRKEPDFIIYAAPPDLTASTRKAFIAKLKAAGVSVNFDYEFTLGKQKEAMELALYDKILKRENRLAADEAEFLDVYRQLSDEGKADVVKKMEALLKEQGEGRPE